MSQGNWYQVSLIVAFLLLVSGVCAMENDQRAEDLRHIINNFRVLPMQDEAFEDAALVQFKKDSSSEDEESGNTITLPFDMVAFQQKFQAIVAGKSMEEVASALLENKDFDLPPDTPDTPQNRAEWNALVGWCAQLSARKKKGHDHYNPELADIFGSKESVIVIPRVLKLRNPSEDLTKPLLGNNVKKIENTEQKRFEPIITGVTLGVLATVVKVGAQAGSFVSNQMDKRKKKKKEKKEKEKADFLLQPFLSESLFAPTSSLPLSYESEPFTNFLAPECFPTSSPVSSGYSSTYNNVLVHYPDSNMYDLEANNNSEMACAGVFNNQSMQGPLRASYSSTETNTLS